MFRKLNKASIVVGEMFVAYAPNVPELAVNGTKGVIVNCTHNNRIIKLQIPNGEEVRFDINEEGAFVHRIPEGMPMVIRVADTTQWPEFSERMHQEGVNGMQIEFSQDCLYKDEDDESEHFGTEYYFFDSHQIDPDDDKPYVNNILLRSLFPLNEPEWVIPRAERMGMGVVELPLPVKPAAQEHNVVIEKLTKRLGKLKAIRSSANVNFCKVDDKFKDVAEFKDQACHRAIREYHGDSVRWVLTQGIHHGGEASQRHWNKGMPSREVMEFYITYLTSYSPYADVFVTKDPAFIIENGYILDASKSAILLTAACYATRQLWERKARLEAFYALYQAGIPLDMAFVFGASCSQFGADGVKFTEDGASHSHLRTGKLSDNAIIAFCQHKRFDDESYAENEGIGNVDTMWDVGTERSECLTEMRSIKKICGVPGISDMLPPEEAIERAADCIDAWRQINGL